MAVKLVEDMRQEWQPGNFHDTYRDDLLRRIESKVKAGNTRALTAAAAKPRERRTAEVVDLSELLKRSLADRGGKAAAGTNKRAPARARSSGATAATRRRRA